MSIDEPTLRELDLLDQIDELDKIATAAQEHGGWSAAVSARVKITAIRAELARIRDEQEAEAQTDPLLRIRRLARRAAEDGSWTAAAALLKQEQEILEEQRRAAEAAKKTARRGMSEDDLVEALVGRIASMSDKMRQKVLDRLGAPVTVN